jgi:hypothetical protein
LVRDCPECYEDGYRAGLEAMLQQVREQGIPPEIDPAERARLEAKYPEFGKARVNVPETHKPKPKPKPTARNKAYSKAFKSVEADFKKKNGSWKKNGFKNCAKKANGMCK